MLTAKQKELYSDNNEPRKGRKEAAMKGRSYNTPDSVDLKAALRRRLGGVG